MVAYESEKAKREKEQEESAQEPFHTEDAAHSGSLD